MASPKTYGLTHIAMAVVNLEVTKKFYTEVFDMQVMYEEKEFLQLTTPGNNDILVFEKKSNPSRGKTGGIAHIGFRLKRPEDIEEMVRRVKKEGGEILSKGEFVPGSPYVFFTDPDGYEIEIWYELI